jgi:glycosyltransferase involved in cell wall biosynthesis/serine acetyltransferase/ubiquinone/menaquinone biosynthesis C-methylase UbiE
MKISFIIPAYNVENYISKCLDSILRQSISDIEIIVVDDGSVDSTNAILRSYEKNDSRIKVYKQKNAGQGAARTFGLKKAKGDYVWFVDADDWLVDFSLLRIVNILSKNKPDVMVINFEYTFDEKPSQPSNLTPSHLVGRIINPNDDVGNFATVSCWNTPPWRLISNRNHLIKNDIKFAQGVFYEDHPFAINLMLSASKVYVDGSISYSYYQRQDSTTKVNDRKAFDFIEIRSQCLELFRRYGVLEKFAPIVIGYIAPLNFYNAHVSSQYKQEFVDRLSENLTDYECDLVNGYGDLLSKLFVKSIKLRELDYIAKHERMVKFKAKYSIDGLQRLISKTRNYLIFRLNSFLLGIKNTLHRSNLHSGVDLSGRRFLSAGMGTRLESINIDVRLNAENRVYVQVGEYSHIAGTFVFERGVGKVTIGNKTSIGGGTTLICTQEDGIKIGDHVMLSWGCTIMDSDAHSLDPSIRANDAYDWKVGLDNNRIGAFKDWSQVKSASISIEDNAWLGFEVAVMKGVTIGKGAVVGSRSVVTKNIPPYCIYAGNPAKFIKHVPRINWSWDEIILAFHGNPQMITMLKNSYLHEDLMESLERYLESGELLETLVEIKRYSGKDTLKVLDVGGGAGVMAVALAIHGFDVTLIEPGQGAIAGAAGARRLLDLACQKFDKGLRSRVKIINEYIEDFQIDVSEYDLVYCRQVVHHFSDPLKVLKKLNRAIKENGLIMMIREHVINNEDDKKIFLENHPFHKYTHSENAYTEKQYLDFLKQSGFDLIRVYKFADTLMNTYPHDIEIARQMNEVELSGRPYSFIARKAI